MKRILFILIALGTAGVMMAQPAKSRVQNARTTAAKNSEANGPSRASLMFPTTVDVPEDPTWRRDIYRSIDLTKDENAALYYPVEPQNGQMNLFTLLFKLLSTGKIPAYKYMDVKEDFRDPEARLHFVPDLLEPYRINYEVNGNSVTVLPSDIPSADVLSYYVKESSYYDQNTATYHSRVVALCPILHRAADEWSYSSEVQKSGLFWVKYDDVKAYLSGQEVMVSNLNNAAKMSIDDFFSTNHYKGDIYMTNNMQNKVLHQVAATDSLLKKEQGRIEKELTDFEKNIWKTPVDSVELARRDSIAAANTKGRRERSVSASSSASSERVSRRGSASSGDKDRPRNASGGSSSPRVSVRRQRHLY
ncbi:MAG: gliding motility protein GldN [Bacteroidales bacterium]|nr:gliding motility protein GldN [Bacteroidales bacterium]